MAKEYKLQVTKPPEARNDGSGYIGNDVWKVWREDDAQPNDPWNLTPRHKSGVPIYHTDVMTIIVMPPAAAQTAYRAKLLENRNLTPIPNNGWTDAKLDAFYAENNLATAAATAFAQFIEDAGKTFPFVF